MNIGMVLEILSQRRMLRARECWTRQKLESYQREALLALRQYAYARSSFYRRFHQGLYEAPLQELPVLTKATLMDNFDELVTDQAIRLEDVRSFVARPPTDGDFLGCYRAQSTSGTSGHPGLFIYSRLEWSATLAAALRAFEGAGIRFSLTHRTRMAQITSSNPSHMSAQGASSMRSWWTPCLMLNASDHLETMVERLNHWQPEVLLAYASILGILADEQIEGGF